MTIIQASICNSGKTLVLIGDRMITTTVALAPMRTYETEGKSPKLYQIGKFALGFAGSLADIIFLKDIISEQFEKQPDMSFDEFVELIRTLYEGENEARLKEYVERYALISYDIFKKAVAAGGTAIPTTTINWIYANCHDNLLDCNVIIIGFDEKNVPKIIEINNKCAIKCHSDQFNHAIGSGQMFSMIYFDTRGYESSCSREYGLFFSYQAKKSAEAHVGVGEQTDMIIIDQDGRNVMIKDDSDEMKELKQLHCECQKEIEKKYNEYAGKIKEM